MTPSQFQEYLHELLKALCLVLLSATALYTSQYSIKWWAEKTKQMAIMIGPWQLEKDKDPEGDRIMILGLDVRSR